jgi:lipopolysaccharide transport system permease protein
MEESVIENWDTTIKSQSKWNEIDFKEIWKYRDLMLLMVRRDFVSVYKQTILGPLWFFIQTLLTALTFTIIFGWIAKIKGDGTPYFLFYLAGLTLWTYFSDCLNKTSNTFVANAGVFGKVYFPRLIVPLSILISNLLKLGIIMVLFLCVWFYYLFTSDSIHPQYHLLWLFPYLVIVMAGLGLGFGILISSLTTKYRDLTFLVGFGAQLFMYASPVVYPLSIVTGNKRWFIILNPVSSIIESFKCIFLGKGILDWLMLSYSSIFMVVLLFISIIIFHKVEKSFMDTV